jgi:trk system potassium uptake protein
MSMGNLKTGIKSLRLEPARVLVLGIMAIVLLGSLLLNLPIASREGESIGFINALFTAASAVSVTGLVVVNTAEHWTVFGKVVIIVLIQAGGLGFMTLATLIALILGKKIGLRDRLIIQEQLNQFSLSGVVKLTKYVIMSTFAIELLGAFLLATRFVPIYGWGNGIAFSLFHAISAFCNAGFDITGSSMELYVGDPIIILTLSLLVIMGGLGYTVFLDMARKKTLKRASLHTKMVFRVNALLLLTGFVFIMIVEYNNPSTFGNLSFNDKVLASIFQTVITRTAGFNSVNIGGIKSATALFFIILMFIGGSPSSTAGGIKTTTFGVLMATIASIVKGKEDVEIMSKRIPTFLVFRALAVTMVSMSFVLFMTMVLTLTETHNFIDVMFEVTSAFATVGLSRGITPDLSDYGKLIITVTMFVGKVGPLTLAFALAKRHKQYDGKIRYPEDKLMVG